MNTETPNTTDAEWRTRFSGAVGGRGFDAQSGGYSFSAVLADERELEKKNAAGDSQSALLKLSVADPVWKMPRGALEAGMKYYEVAWDATRYKDNTGVRATPDTIMTEDTHAKMARLLQARHSVVTEDGKGLTEDWVQHSPGSIKRMLAEYLPTLFFEDRTTLLFPSPSYQVIASPMNRRGAVLLNAPLKFMSGRWGLAMGDLTRTVEESVQEKLFLYANLPHNPTGTGYTRQEWEVLITWACKYGVMIIVDEAYIDLRYRSEIVSVLQVPGWERCCIVLQSVSKGWNATGLRFGWAIAHPTVIKALRKVMDVKDSGLFGPSIVAGIWCLLHPEIAEETNRAYSMLHTDLALGLKKSGFVGRVPDAGLCQFTPAPKSANGVEFATAADSAKWLRETLRISVMHAEADGRQWLRWAVTIQAVPKCCLHDETEVIAEVVRRLKSVEFVF